MPRIHARRHFHHLEKLAQLLQNSRVASALARKNPKNPDSGRAPSRVKSLIRRLGRKVAVFCSWAFYMPTITGTFWLPMWVGLAIVLPTIFNYYPESPASIMLPLPQWIFRIFYISWIPLMIFPETEWLMEFLLLPEIWTNIYVWLLIKTVRPFMTLLGFGFFLSSLIQMTIAKRKEAALVTTGFYSVVRHPQYLGIIIWTFGHVLYGLPMFLRTADFLAWVTLVFTYLLLADFEENRLEKESESSAYSEYREKVHFMIPFVNPGTFKCLCGILPRKRWKKLAIFFCVYALAMALSALYFWGRTYRYWP